MQWYEQLDEKIRDYLPDMTVERDAPMSRAVSSSVGSGSGSTDCCAMACPAWSSPCW